MSRQSRSSIPRPALWIAVPTFVVCVAAMAALQAGIVAGLVIALLGAAIAATQTTKVGTAIHSAGRGIDDRLWGDIFCFCLRRIPAFKFARRWFQNPFAGAANAASICGKRAQRLGGRIRQNEMAGLEARP